MPELMARADDVLHSRWRAASAWTDVLWLIAIVGAFGALYGAAMGGYGLVNSGVGALQIVYSAIKLPMLLLVTFAISLPSFFVINSLFGLRRDFGDAVRALVATQAAVSIISASLAPLTMLWYLSFDGYSAAILFNAVVLGVASISAQAILRGHYRELIRRRPVHRSMVRAWMIVYAFVGIQMGWVLRPFVGDPNSPVQFFREDSWGNAYLIVGKLIWTILLR